MPWSCSTFLFFTWPTRYIRRSFVIYMVLAVFLFAGFLMALRMAPAFIGDPLEIIVFGGAILGIGVGSDHSPWRMYGWNGNFGDPHQSPHGFTVGQVVLFINVFIFAAYGWIFQDWHIALRSLMTYIVAFKMIDLVIVGLDELKSALIISSHPKEMAKCDHG